MAQIWRCYVCGVGRRATGPIRPPAWEPPYAVGVAPEKTKRQKKNKPTKILIQKDTHNPMFRAALFTVGKRGKQPKCPLIDEWIKRTYTYLHRMEYYSVIKKNEILPSETTCSELVDIMLSEISQRKTYCMISLMYGT